MTQSSNNILNSLGDLAIFKLSLGSKELFHSNFLEFLWNFDKACFLNMINALLDKPLPIRPDIQYELGREKENFDICIFHKKVNCIIYDLIIENKVKSIPYKEQLDKYEERIANKNSKKRKKESKSNPRYLLLSLALEFPEKKLISGTWKIVHYDDLKTAIEQQVWPSSKPGYSYIGEYCEFIDKLHKLGVAILDNLSNEMLFQNVAKFKTERMHDLYIKLRCTSFMLELKALLENPKNNVPVCILAADRIREVDENQKYINKAGVYLNVNIFKAVGQIGALIWDGQGDIYEVVIQGEQYRHGINPKVKESGKDKREMLDKMWERHLKDPRACQFLNMILDKAPHECKKKKAGPYNEYNDAYIYRYVNYKKDLNLNVKPLLDVMADDIVATYRTLTLKPTC